MMFICLEYGDIRHKQFFLVEIEKWLILKHSKFSKKNKIACQSTCVTTTANENRLKELKKEQMAETYFFN